MLSGGGHIIRGGASLLPSGIEPVVMKTVVAIRIHSAEVAKVCKWGDTVDVLEPPELREMVARHPREALGPLP